MTGRPLLRLTGGACPLVPFSRSHSPRTACSCSFCCAAISASLALRISACAVRNFFAVPLFTAAGEKTAAAFAGSDRNSFSSSAVVGIVMVSVSTSSCLLKGRQGRRVDVIAGAVARGGPIGGFARCRALREHRQVPRVVHGRAALHLIGQARVHRVLADIPGLGAHR